MNEVLNKKGLVEAVVSKLDMTKKDANIAVEAIFEAMSNALAHDQKVEISGFGKFEAKTRAGRIGINPSTKEAMEILPTRSVHFKAAKALKDSVN